MAEQGGDGVESEEGAQWLDIRIAFNPANGRAEVRRHANLNPVFTLGLLEVAKQLTLEQMEGRGKPERTEEAERRLIVPRFEGVKLDG